MFEEIWSTVKKKAEETKEKAVKKKEIIQETVKKYPQVVKPVLTAAGMVALGAIRTINSIEQGKIEACKVQDDVSGLDFVTKHPLTNQEILELDSKLMEGQTTGEALQDMKLLRKERKRK